MCVSAETPTATGREGSDRPQLFPLSLFNLKFVTGPIFDYDGSSEFQIEHPEVGLKIHRPSAKIILPNFPTTGQEEAARAFMSHLYWLVPVVRACIVKLTFFLFFFK